MKAAVTLALALAPVTWAQSEEGESARNLAENCAQNLVNECNGDFSPTSRIIGLTPEQRHTSTGKSILQSGLVTVPVPNRDRKHLDKCIPG